MNKTVLDSNTYHIFRIFDKSVLYDLATGTIADIDNMYSYDVIEQSARFDIAGLCNSLKSKYPDSTEQSVLDAIKPLKNKGFFKNTPADLKRIEYAKKSLLAHNSDNIQLSITQACNLACIYCYAEASGSNSKNKLMSFEVAKESIDYLVRTSGNKNNLSIQFFGGEPLMNFELIKQVVEYAKQISASTVKKFRHHISTNCTLLTAEVQDYLVKHRFGALVSIDGDKITHDKQRPYRNGDSSFDIAFGNAMSLNEKFIRAKLRPPRIRANIINGNVTRLCEITDMFTSFGFKAIGIAPIIARAGEIADFVLKEEDMAKFDEQFDKQIQHWLDCKLNDKPHYNAYVENEVRKMLAMFSSSKLFGGIRCGVGRNVNTVDTEGNIFPCHRYLGMDKFIIGNVYTGINKEKLLKYYDSISNNMLENCKDCWMKFKCGGACPWQISNNEGNLCPSDKVSCNDRKHHFELAAYLYLSLINVKPDVLDKYIKGK